MMKKASKCIAAALLGGSAGLSFAQSNVTLYGVIDVGVQQTRLSPGSTTTGLVSGVQSGSRWGLKGTEDLGGGMSATFQLEEGVNVNNGSLGQGGLAFGRQAWVGLNGDLGSVKMGRQYTPLFIVLDTIDPFDMGLTGDGSGIGAVFRSGGVRNNNAVDYSKSFGPFSAEVSYAFGNVPGSASAGRQIGLGLTYAEGPLTLVFGHHNANLDAGSAITGTSKTTAIGGMYDLKAVKLHAAYAVNKDSIGSLNTEDSRDGMLGVSVPMGAVSVMAAYVRHNDRLAAKANAAYWELAATYDLSKRTNLYAAYSTVRNDDHGAVGSGLEGADIGWLNVGIRHKF